MKEQPETGGPTQLGMCETAGRVVARLDCTAKCAEFKASPDAIQASERLLGRLKEDRGGFNTGLPDSSS